MKIQERSGVYTGFTDVPVSLRDASLCGAGFKNTTFFIKYFFLIFTLVTKFNFGKTNPSSTREETHILETSLVKRKFTLLS